MFVAFYLSLFMVEQHVVRTALTLGDDGTWRVFVNLLHEEMHAGAGRGPPQENPHQREWAFWENLRAVETQMDDGTGDQTGFDPERPFDVFDFSPFFT
jgi:hypothetical protein